MCVFGSQLVRSAVCVHSGKQLLTWSIDLNPAQIICAAVSLAGSNELAAVALSEI